MTDQNSENYKLEESSALYSPNTLASLQRKTSELALKTSNKQLLINSLGELKAGEMPCIFTDEEYVEEIRLSEQSDTVSNNDVIKELQSWGFAI